MQTLLIEQTEKTPQITFHCGVLRITGKSITQDAGRFYFPVIKKLSDWIDKKEIKKIIIQLKFVNLPSFRELEKIIKIFEISSLGKIDYYYGKNDIIWKAKGEQLKSDFPIVELIEAD